MIQQRAKFGLNSRVTNSFSVWKASLIELCKFLESFRQPC